MTLREFFSEFPLASVKVTTNSIELFDENLNNLLWMHKDGRFYSKSFQLTDKGWKESRVAGYKKNSNGNLEAFSRETIYTKEGYIKYETSSDGRKDNNLYREKLKMELEQRKPIEEVDKGKQLF